MRNEKVYSNNFLESTQYTTQTMEIQKWQFNEERQLGLQLIEGGKLRAFFMSEYTVNIFEVNRKNE